MLRHDLAAEGGNGVLDQLIAVVKIHGLSHAVDDLESLGKCDLEAVRDCRGMDSLGEEVLTGSEKGAGHNDD